MQRSGIALGGCAIFYMIAIWIPQTVYLYPQAWKIQEHVNQGRWDQAESAVTEVLFRQGLQTKIIDLHLQILIHKAESSDNFLDWMQLLQVASRYKSRLYWPQYTSTLCYSFTAFYLRVGKTIDPQYYLSALQYFAQLQKKGFHSISSEAQKNLFQQMIEVYIREANYPKAKSLVKMLEKMQVNDILLRHCSAVILYAEGCNQEALQELQSFVFSQKDLSGLRPSIELLILLYEKLDLIEPMRMLVDYVGAMRQKVALEEPWIGNFLRKYEEIKAKKKRVTKIDLR